MTRDDYEIQARALAAYVATEVRLAFQTKHPHYTPPEIRNPAVRAHFWRRWLEANRERHGGEAACVARFGALWATGLEYADHPGASPAASE